MINLFSSNLQMLTTRGKLMNLQRACFSTSAASIKKVCIIGGGVAGLQTADRLKSLDLNCTIFEQKPDVGGVWRSNYAEFGLQVPWNLYEFPGFRYKADENKDDFPRGPQV